MLNTTHILSFLPALKGRPSDLEPTQAHHERPCGPSRTASSQAGCCRSSRACVQPKSHASATLTLTVPSCGCSMHPGWPGCWTLNRRRPLVMSARLHGPSPTSGGCKIHPQLDTGVACTCNYRGFARRFTTAHWGNSIVRSFRIELGRSFPHRHSPCDVDCGSCCLHLQPARIRVYVPN